MINKFFLGVLNSLSLLIEIPYTLLFGKARKVEHIWKPVNYQRNNIFFWRLIQKPLQSRGIYLPLNYKKLHSLNEFQTFHDEHKVINDYLKNYNDFNLENCFLDIGASDGIDMSNTFNLALEGYKGFLFEVNSSNFAKLSTVYRDFNNVELFKTKITPNNVNNLLKALNLPKVIKVLNLDIDSYDYYVLSELLNSYKFQYLILEINPIFPSSIDFTVEYDPQFIWEGNNFQGVSLSMLYKLLERNNYSIVHVDRAFALAVNNKYCDDNINKFSIFELEKQLDNSLKNKAPEKWETIYKNFRNKPEEQIISEINNLFKNYKNYYIKKSGFSKTY